MVAQHVWNGLNVVFWSSEMFRIEAIIIYKKICILLQKIAFWAFFHKLQKEHGFLKRLFSIH